jgi:AcrR family transcriptional regulator
VGVDAEAVPRVARPRTRRGQARREELLGHAVRLLAERGLDDVRVKDIVEASGISNSLFYWYFEDVDDVIRAIVVDARRALRHAAADAVAGLDSPLDQLYVSCQKIVRIGVEDEVHRVVTVTDAESHLREPYATEVRASFAAFIGDALGVLAEGQVRGLVRTNVPALHLAYGVRGVVNYTITAYHRGLVVGDPVPLSHSVAGFALRAVVADSAMADDVESRRGPATAGP